MQLIFWPAYHRMAEAYLYDYLLKVYIESVKERYIFKPSGFESVVKSE